MAAKLHVINDDEESSDYVSKEEFEESSLYSVYADGIASVQLSDILTLNEKVTNDMKGNYNYFDNAGNPKGNEIPTIAEQPYEMNVSKFNDAGEINEKYFEEYELKRNEIFNRYLNTHQVKYIELEQSVATDANSTVLADGRTVLADDNDNPIFFALASTGIHFMSMVWNSNDPLSVNFKDGAAIESLSSLALEKNGYKVEDGKTALETAQAKFENNFNRKINEAYFTLYDDEENNVNYNKYQYTYIGRIGAYNTETNEFIGTSSAKLIITVNN